MEQTRFAITEGFAPGPRQYPARAVSAGDRKLFQDYFGLDDSATADELKCAVLWLLVSMVAALAAEQRPSAPTSEPESLASALSPNQWNQVEQSIDRALVWLARQQERDGSIDAPDSAQPA